MTDETNALLVAIEAAARKTYVTPKMMPAVPWNPAEHPASDITIESNDLRAFMPSEAWSDIVFAAAAVRAREQAE